MIHFFSHWPLFLISAYIFPPLLYLFRDEFRIVLHLGFTYTTYSTVKSEFPFFDKFRLKKVRDSKLEKQGLGCAIHMKEYTIMMLMYLANQIPWSNNQPF